MRQKVNCFHIVSYHGTMTHRGNHSQWIQQLPIIVFFYNLRKKRVRQKVYCFHIVTRHGTTFVRLNEGYHREGLVTYSLTIEQLKNKGRQFLISYFVSEDQLLSMAV